MSLFNSEAEDKAMTMLPSMVAFRGDLSVFNILDIIQLIHTAQKTGKLCVYEYSRRLIGEVIFNFGRVVSARYSDCDDEGAVENLLQVQDGSFEFLPSLNPFQVRIHLSTPSLLMQCLKHLDEQGTSLVGQHA
jgi:hypothetical protein